VVYDREGSSVSLTPGEAYDWEAAFEDAGWLHFTGITPALSEVAAEACRIAAMAARAKGLTVSTDLNFRKKLWNWEPGTAPRDLAEKTMRSLLPLVDVVVANEEDAGDVLSIHAANTDVQAGRIDAGKYVSVARQIVEQFPNVSRVAITLRESVSASHNNWGGMLFDRTSGEAAFAPLDPDGQYAPYEIRNIVDRVGGGDSFAASLIFALNTPELSGRLQDTVDFAVAGSCLAHSIYGDFNFTTRDEVKALLKSGGSGRVVR
jgi:2-dehydro-3-deoxygluconokinase